MYLDSVEQIIYPNDTWTEHEELVYCGLWGNEVFITFTNIITGEEKSFDIDSGNDDEFRKNHYIVSEDIALQYKQKKEEHDRLIEKMMDPKYQALQLLEHTNLENKETEFEYQRPQYSISPDGYNFFLTLPLYSKVLHSFIKDNIDIISKINHQEIMNRKKQDEYYSAWGNMINNESYENLISLFNESKTLQDDVTIIKISRKFDIEKRLKVSVLKWQRPIQIEKLLSLFNPLIPFTLNNIKLLFEYNIEALKNILSGKSYVSKTYDDVYTINSYLKILEKFYNQIKDWDNKYLMTNIINKTTGYDYTETLPEKYIEFGY